MRIIPTLLFSLGLLAVVGRTAETNAPKFDLEGEKWTYTDGERSFGGFLVKPAGYGPFPAVIINHGKGGRPDGLPLTWAHEMVKWGLVAICPTLTHVAGTTIEGQEGASAENLARERICVEILKKLGFVDMKRLAVAGHSMGAYLTIGFSGVGGVDLKAAAITAGGVKPQKNIPAPSTEMAEGIKAPFLILHGLVDGAVAPKMSADLKEILDKNGVANRRVLFEAMNHDLPTNPATKDVVLALVREWFVDQGVIPGPGNTKPAIAAPADLKIAMGSRLGPLTFTVGDRETAASRLTVTASSSCARVLPAANITLSGDGAERTLAATLAEGQGGPLTIFLTVSDGGLVATTSFVVGVTDASGVVPDPAPERVNPNRRNQPPPPPR